ncbi:MAG: prolyl oligopeptidase family serine peptidase [Phycisphaerales bacterium]
MYKSPPPAVARVLDAAPSPTILLDPTRRHALLMTNVALPPIADLAAPMLRLAGGRYNAAANAPHGPRAYVGATLKRLADGRETPLALPADASIESAIWSADGERFAIPVRFTDGVELWVGTTGGEPVRRLIGRTLNMASGPVARWMPGDKALLCRFIPNGRGPIPPAPGVPSGPVIQETSGVKAQVRTYQDLLQNTHDELVYDWLLTAQLAVVDFSDGKRRDIGGPAIFSTMDPSPSGEYLLVSKIERPYSYAVPDGLFPEAIEVWRLADGAIIPLHRAPLREDIPIEGVETGPRGFAWRDTVPATLTYAEALDGGDPKNPAQHRDRVLSMDAPFEEPQEILRTEHRFRGISWLAPADGLTGGEALAMVSEYDRDRKWSRTWFYDSTDWAKPARLLWDRSVNDRYNAPGSPLRTRLASGRAAVRADGGFLLLSGPGATPEGDRPFLRRLDLRDFATTELWRCEPGSFESVVDVMADGVTFLTVHESPADVPNLYRRAVGGGARERLTAFEDQTPELRKVRKELVKYTRSDGVELSATLYLPPDYKDGTKLPLLVWAYPLEFTDKATAGQVASTPTRFTRFGGISHLCLALSGYAVMDGATMPVVGDPETVNDTFVEQIVASAQAAIDKAVEMGVADRDRVAVGGHSYGAFMTANLLAHCDLFKAGIARSGAYNRTLTPFGFQGERRTYWEAVDTYTKMSPFTYADKIKAPMLMIHGQLDSNPGTFPVQSERMYAAIKGQGGTARLVMLPFESHGYAARESAMHVQAEMLEWLDAHVKNYVPVPAKNY